MLKSMTFGGILQSMPWGGYPIMHPIICHTRPIAPPPYPHPLAHVIWCWPRWHTSPKVLRSTLWRCMQWFHSNLWSDRRWLGYWGLTPQQQPGSYQGGENDDEISFLVEETGVPGGNHRPTYLPYGPRRWRVVFISSVLITIIMYNKYTYWLKSSSSLSHNYSIEQCQISL